jgi:hypothetical protein
MTAPVQWSQTALDAFLRIQTIINVSAWGVYMSALIKNDTSLDRDSGIKREELIESNMSIIREESPSVQVVITNGHSESKRVLSFGDFEEICKAFEKDKIKWWPVNFETKVDCQVWIEQHIQAELAE